jgi:hypothetical protein
VGPYFRLERSHRGGPKKGTFYLFGEGEIFVYLLVFAQHTGRGRRL